MKSANFEGRTTSDDPHHQDDFYSSNRLRMLARTSVGNDRRS